MSGLLRRLSAMRTLFGGRADREAVVIGIHGLANKPPSDEKRRWWQAAILEGLRRNEGVADAEVDLDFVYWADLRYDAPLSDDSNLEPYRPHDGEGPLPGQEAAPTTLTGDVLATVYKGIDAAQDAIGVTIVDDVILEHRFDDLWHYQSEQVFARQVRARLSERLQAFRDRRILLVAHSMGAVIAYDVLRQLESSDATLQVEHLVTVGAPLGLTRMKHKVEAETEALRVPNNVRHWTNLADGDDVVAVAGELARKYGPNEHGVEVVDKRVVNDYHRPSGEVNHHKSYGYLRTPEFSRIARAFTLTRPRRVQRASADPSCCGPKM